MVLGTKFKLGSSNKHISYLHSILWSLFTVFSLYILSFAHSFSVFCLVSLGHHNWQCQTGAADMRGSSSSKRRSQKAQMPFTTEGNYHYLSAYQSTLFSLQPGLPIIEHFYILLILPTTIALYHFYHRLNYLREGKIRR